MDIVFKAECGCRYKLLKGAGSLRGAVLECVERCNKH